MPGGTSADARDPGGTSGAFCPYPEVLSPASRNAEGPDGAGIFKSPNLTPEGKEPDLGSETTTEGPTAMLSEETTTPEPILGGDE
ncbi:hypothetical protein NDU88_002532 [Pleurodeles waltl]|uniref:Uncharacterized protein n=1 Tax=Pleurodeles waltl TaxID=8319 RepID=A0AAV7UWF9_PLEWA|nr:hypothetical protein NDU88_002532 [Pleurodeles waltl]